MTETVELGDLGDLGDGELRAFEGIGPSGIVVCRVGGALHAIDDRCSHADTPLRDGRLRGAVLTCPMHGAQFDVRDGSHLGPPAYTGVRCHRVEEASTGAIVHLSPADAAASTPDPGQRLRTR
jgi:3-phenylpropionate/trans-cinnamate dioxygenase ferredoxin subunit